ncbi:DUF6301 family protein [Nocardia sp. NPDC058114]|uniref:DUF6301 family protein n=1 Tax=Nocardia sp. NPDC058114 TaxID=3346346 RepID=UPI0036DF680E
MRADIDGAVHIALIARGFGWTWTEPDVTRFCQATGWSILHEDRGLGPSLRTNLDVHLPHCSVDFKRRKTLTVPQRHLEERARIELCVLS